MEEDVKVRDAMTPKVLTVKPSESVDKAAKIMADKNIGSIIVVKNDKPVGIVTERDICYRVVASNKLPSKVSVKDIMSSHLITVSPDNTLNEAARTMAKKNIRRLPVVKDNSLVGIITNKDIITISPEICENLKEIVEISRPTTDRTGGVPEKGTCEICGEYMVTIYEVDGKFICEDCKEDSFG